ncbi:hypothetical protein E4U43_005784 [Claviceps pusilla]|uniref:Uncharacterized protein n=1 Tax=Claviceps pusilla TaxID=123648 RepID=A0A9P7N423_9HYPO|nr:hypothetical protein E4U43_005784 [Claviceps pusilla]
MLFTPVVIAFTAWQSLAAAAAVENAAPAAPAPETCVQAHHLMALTHTLDHLQADVKPSERLRLPQIPPKYYFEPQTCLPESLSELFVEPIIQLSKEQNMIEKLDSLLQTPPPGYHASQARDVVARLDKRIRNCPQMRDSAIATQSVWSCDSAKDADACRSCAAVISFNLVFACTACASKMNHESLFCCAAAASTFVTGYTQVCLRR